MLNSLAANAPLLVTALVGLLAAALFVSWLLRARGKQQRGKATRSRQRLNWRSLEPRVAAAFRRQGFEIMAPDTSSLRIDGELRIRRDRQTFVVHCGEWDTAKVGVGAVQVLQRAMSTQSASGGYLLTNGRFAREAQAAAAACDVRLIDGMALPGLLDGSGHLPARPPTTP